MSSRSTCFSSTRFSYQHTYAERTNGEGVPTLGMLGVKSWMYTQGKIPGQDMLKAGLWNSANTGIFLCRHAAVLTGLRLDASGRTASPSAAPGRVRARTGDGPFQADGHMTFNGLITSGTANANGGLNFADFLLGYPSSYRLGGSQINDAYVHSPGLYVNDVWRVNRRITLNFGLRWEPNLAPKDRNGFVVGWSRENFDKGIRSTVYPNAPLGLMYKGDPGFPTNNANYFNNYNAAVAAVWPRVGSERRRSSRPFGPASASTTIRPNLWRTAHHPLNSPFGNTADAIVPSACPGKPNRNGCPIDFLNPWSSTPGGDPMVRAGFPHQGEPVNLPPSDIAFPLNGGYVSLPTDAKPMRSYQYNLSYQRQLMERVLLDVTYTGNQQRNIWIGGYAENPAVYIPGNCVAGQYALTAPGPCSNTSANNRQARSVLTLLNPTEGRSSASTPAGNHIGVTAGVDGRHRSLQRAQDRHPEALELGLERQCQLHAQQVHQPGNPSPDINWNLRSTPQAPDYKVVPDFKTPEGACYLDRRHVFNLSSVLISPGVGSGLVRAITKDWQVGLIFQARSGSPFTPTVSEDNALTGEPNQRPVLVARRRSVSRQSDLGSECRRLQHPAAVAQHGGVRQRASWAAAATLLVACSPVQASGTPTSRSPATSTLRPDGASNCVSRRSTSSTT